MKYLGFLTLYIFCGSYSHAQTIIFRFSELDEDPHIVRPTEPQPFNKSPGNRAFVEIRDVPDTELASIKLGIIGQDSDKFTSQSTNVNLSDITVEVTSFLEREEGGVRLPIKRNGTTVAEVNFLVQAAPPTPETTDNPGVARPKTPSPDSQVLQKARIYLSAQLRNQADEAFEGKLDPKRNLFIGKEGKVIKVFLDHKGRVLGSGCPTTAREENLYQFIVIHEANVGYVFTFEHTGSFFPQFNVYPTPAAEETTAAGAAPQQIRMTHTASAVLGPFTDQFTIAIKSRIEDGPESTILDKTIQVAKRFYYTFKTGYYATNLRNPSNIMVSENADGDQTLIADEPDERGHITLSAVFFFNPQYFQFPPEGPFSLDRLGLSVGTQVNNDSFEDLFAGIDYVLTRGVSLNLGAHFGKRNFIPGLDKDFEFGVEVFQGTFDAGMVKQEWDTDWYMGLNVDLRAATQFITGSN